MVSGIILFKSQPVYFFVRNYSKLPPYLTASRKEGWK